MHNIHKPVAIITGASKGIGFEAAKDLLARGWRVVVFARGRQQIETARQMISTDDALFLVGDVSNLQSVEEIVKKTLSTFGGINTLINNASVIDPIGHFHQQQYEAWMKLLEVNIGGIFNTCKSVLPSMISQGGGCIINISSGAARKSVQGWSAYCVSKAAALMLTSCLHEEYNQNGIRVHSFVPGAVATDMLQGALKSFDNAVTKKGDKDLLPAELPGRCIGWIAAEGNNLESGIELSIRDPQLRKRVGLPEGYHW